MARTQGRAPPTKGAPLYCLIPPELEDLREVIARDLPAEGPVEVLVDRRRRERRAGAERRSTHGRPPAGIERRLAHDLEGRRFAERRTPLVPVAERPPLPPEARPYAERLQFVKPQLSPQREREVARLRALAAEWRRTAGAASNEAIVNLAQRQVEGRDALEAALGARDLSTWEHSAAVVWLALECAEEIGLGTSEKTEIHDVALLHDIGKIGIPDAILKKRGTLSEEEWDVMRRHPVIGARLIDSIDSLSHLGPAIRAEHERWDGKGYPDGLAGEEIPIASRIVFACDAYHAMVSERPYRKPMSPQAARAELARNLGTQFWSEAAGSLLNVLKHGEPRDRAQVALPRKPPATARRQRKRLDYLDGSEPARGSTSASASGEEAALSSRAKAYRQLMERAAMELAEARAAALHHEEASRAALERCKRLTKALERVLNTTKRSHGYSPTVFLARARAELALERDGHSDHD